MALRPLCFQALLCLLILTGLAGAHQELLFANVTSRPAVPAAEEQLELQVKLSNSANREISGVDLLVELYQPGAASDPVGDGGSGGTESPLPSTASTGEDPTVPIEDDEDESNPGQEPLAVVDLQTEEGSGLYRGVVPPLEAGSYRLRVVEMVGTSEESSASGQIRVNGEEPLELELVLPPTESGLGAWLLWLVGLPLLAGVLVALLVLTGRERSDQR